MLFHDGQVWGETWLYSETYISQSVTTLKAMATYLKHLRDSEGIDNVILLQLVNEPWVFLDMGSERVALIEPTQDLLTRP
jgi:hypothetical protein